MNIQALEEQVKQHLFQADQIMKRHEGKGTSMTAQEETEFSNLADEADRLQGLIESAKRLDRVQKWSEQSASAGLPMGGGSQIQPERPSVPNAEDEKKSVRQAWQKFLKGGILALNPNEVKAYQADNPAGGGFLISPQDFVNDLIMLVKDQVFIRQLSKVYTLNRAESLGLPAMDTDPADADWTAELLTGNEESIMAFGKRELRPHPVAKNIKVSNKLLRTAAVNAESVILDRLAYKFAVTEEKAFLTGTGANQPLGIFVADSTGISASRDVTAATTTAVAADDFIDTKYALKASYQSTSIWVMHRDVVKAARKLKDTTNNYIWTAGMNAFGGATGPGNGLQGTPERLLDNPIAMSEYSPSTFTTGLYLAILGDFQRGYAIVDSLDMQMQVLDQLYAATNQTGYIGRRETDGMPVLEEAFSRLKLR